MSEDIRELSAQEIINKFNNQELTSNDIMQAYGMNEAITFNDHNNGFNLNLNNY